MNLSTVLFRIKLQLGLLNIATPFEDLDGTIVKIINEITLPVFSIYQPSKEDLNINTNYLRKIDKGANYHTYLLPEFKPKKLLYVLDLNYVDTSMTGIGYYGSGMPLFTGNLVSQSMLSNASNQLISQMMPRVTFEFKSPRTIRIFNVYQSAELKFTLGFEHLTVDTINETSREAFMELVFLDVKSNLYPTLKQYTELNTAYGNINLKLDDWADAAQKREDLINKWDDTYHLDMPNLYYF